MRFATPPTHLQWYPFWNLMGWMPPRIKMGKESCSRIQHNRTEVGFWTHSLDHTAWDKNFLFLISYGKAKRKKSYVSKLVTDWKTWPKCVFFLTFFFFFWAADVSNLGRSQLCSVWNMELDLWMNKIQDRTQSWRSLLYKVFYYVCHFFSSIFWQASS